MGREAGRGRLGGIPSTEESSALMACGGRSPSAQKIDGKKIFLALLREMDNTSQKFFEHEGTNHAFFRPLISFISPYLDRVNYSINSFHLDLINLELLTKNS